jgi:hypothetical protein
MRAYSTLLTPFVRAWTISQRGNFAAALDFDQKIRIELRILVHPVFRIAARIAHYSRSIQDVVDAVMDVPVYPQACPASVDEVLGIRDKARIQQ